MAKVAVITRTKDRPVFLKRAIDSVSSQTFNDYIHVIVNDGGDKNAIEALISTLPEETKSKTRLFNRLTSSNAPDTIFNESIDKISSKYFAIHDDDDTWHSEFLERTVEHMEKDQDLGAVVARTDKVIETIQNDVIRLKRQSRWMPHVKVINLYRQCIDNQFTPISTLFRRSAYEAVGKFDSSLPVVGDWEFGIRLLMEYDADFIDPGFSLAHYHHRVSGQGKNSSNHEMHRYYTNKVMNTYLRQELAENRLGVGFIMSQLKFNQTFIALTLDRILPTKVVDKLKRKFSN